MMTKQHFEAFAKTCRQWRSVAVTVGTPAQREFTALAIENAVVEVAAEDNPRFDAARFRQACQPVS